MLEELKDYNFNKNSSGVLVFEDIETFSNVFAVLSRYCDSIPLVDTLSTEDVLSAFEINYNFYSLRSEINSEISVLEQMDNLYEFNDPDNHFIASEVFRALLTPNDEVVIGNFCFFLLEDCNICITNNDRIARNDILSIIHSPNFNIDKIYKYTLGNSNTFVVTDEFNVVKPDFSITNSTTNPMTYSFKSRFLCLDPTRASYFWDFGDGYTSSLKNPSHTYTQNGTKTIRLSVQFDGNLKTIEKKINVNSCSVDYTYTHNENGVYYFKANPIVSSGDQVLMYHWRFYDGADSVVTYYSDASNFITHEFDWTNQLYNVELEMYTQNGCFCSVIHAIDATVNTKCKRYANAHTGTSTNPYFHLHGNKYVKSSMSVYSLVFHHVITSKIVFKEKKNNGSYKNIKASRITTGVAGFYYLSGDTTAVQDGHCGVDRPLSLYKSKNNCKTMECSHRFFDYRYMKVSYHSVGAPYTISDNNHQESRTDIVLHNKISE